MKLSIVIPVYNEEAVLRENIEQLYSYLNANIGQDWRIVIVDNKSTDNTSHVGKELADHFFEVEYLYIEQQGKGAAVKSGWLSERADVYCFMDADLATDLKALPDLINPIIKDNIDICLGSRFLKESEVARSMLRKVISFGYHVVAKIITRTNIKDLPCGFKAVSQKVIDQILPEVKNMAWFFDSEMILLAENRGYKIKEIPVKWQDPAGRKSHVNTISLSIRYTKELLRLRKRLKI